MTPVSLKQAGQLYGGSVPASGGVTLFLDFDGVLHPHPCEDKDLFGRVYLLEALLHDFPEVEIFISSAWRKYHCVDVLKARVGVGIADRIVGATPVLMRTEPHYSEPAEREREIELWMGEFHAGGGRWAVEPHNQERIVVDAPSRSTTFFLSSCIDAASLVYTQDQTE